MNDSANLDLPVFFVTQDASLPLAGALCGLTRPDRFAAFLVDGRSAEEGSETFATGAFAPGAAQAVFAVLPQEDAEKVFDRLNVYLRGKRAPKDLAAEDCEAAIGIWSLPDQQAALLVVDANDNALQPLQTVWEELARSAGYGAYEDGRVLASDRFDAIRAAAGCPASHLAADALRSLTLPEPASKPKRTPSAK